MVSAATAFDLIDTDNDGTLSVDEFVSAGLLAFKGLNEDGLREMFRAADGDGSGSLSRDEFVRLAADYEAAQGGGAGFANGFTALADLPNVFASLDRDRNGTLDLEEFCTALRLFNCSETDAEMEAMFRAADEDGSGTVTYAEFAKLVRGSSVVKKLSQKVVASNVELEAVHRSMAACESVIDPLAMDVLRFWFPPTLSECLNLWFGKDPETDKTIEQRFGSAVRDARVGKLDSWINSPLETVALLILLDQFSRNIFRHSAETFSCDPMALSVVTRSLYYGYPSKMSKLEAVFFALVLTHSENLHHQQLCIEMWEGIVAALPKDDPLRKFDTIFLKHLQVIERFGRFPHRNEVLGRDSTAEEVEFLGDPSYRCVTGRSARERRG
ncbi:hypothetical protein DFJ74DRAFT_144476 [Hyaloraphidium curvatum]|nr:hypothetical protein DFJ74DRAFT_477100 [Hyaloraphidium curvatum]KAI9033053.1 hypothetical protein DFJ74DRAFT_144476 [Hyaloraphidium curvatum]